MGALLGAAAGSEMTDRLSLGLKVNAAIAAAGAVAALWLLRPASRTTRGIAALRPAPGHVEGRG
jgi:hypothetical protein